MVTNLDVVEDLHCGVGLCRSLEEGSATCPPPWTLGVGAKLVDESRDA